MAFHEPMASTSFPSVVELFAREVHEWVAEELDLDPVGILEVHRLLDPAVRPGVLDPGRVEALPRRLPPAPGRRDREVLDPADRLDAGLEPETGEVEEPEQGLVAEVEEEVRRARVVAVLDQLHEREPQQSLVELDGLLDVGADQCGMVDASSGRGGPIPGRLEVPVAELPAASLELS